MKQHSLIGCPSVSVQQGEIVKQMEREQEGYVKVKTLEGKEGNVPTDCLGEYCPVTSRPHYNYHSIPEED